LAAKTGWTLRRPNLSLRSLLNNRTADAPQRVGGRDLPYVPKIIAKKNEMLEGCGTVMMQTNLAINGREVIGISRLAFAGVVSLLTERAESLMQMLGFLGNSGLLERFQDRARDRT
jgi:hypothetical protein